MSAYFVDKLHIDVLVSGAIDFACAARLAKGGDLIIAIEENGTELGKMLWAENARSVNYLNALVYQKTNSALEEIVGFYGFEYRRNLCPTVIAKVLASYEHHACECLGFKQTPAYDFASRLSRRLTKKLPSWDKAPWGIDFPEQIAVRFS